MKTTVVHFAILFAILGGGVLSFFYTQGNPPLQLAIGIMTSLAYIVWGILHHAIHGDLHPKIVIEYALMGAIAILLLLIVMRS